MKKFGKRFCVICNKSYQPTGPTHRYCKRCSEIRRAEVNARGSLEYRIRKGCKIGVGRGNNQGIGESHHTYKNGTGIFRRIKIESTQPPYRCERCDVDMTAWIETKSPRWGVHHRNKDRQDNRLENLELLCKSCHFKEHQMQRNFHKE